MKRIANYRDWTIDAAPIIIAKQRLFESSAVIKRDSGERFVFSDLGNRVYREQAYERAIEWSKHWIDNNYRAIRPPPPPPKGFAVTPALALRAAITVLRDSAESRRMPCGEPLDEASVQLHFDAADALKQSLSELRDFE